MILVELVSGPGDSAFALVNKTNDPRASEAEFRLDWSAATLSGGGLEEILSALGLLGWSVLPVQPVVVAVNELDLLREEGT